MDPTQRSRGPRLADTDALARRAVVAPSNVVALRLVKEAWAISKALCGFCQSATPVSFAPVPLVVPEAVDGLKRLLGR